jgi:hypothetical protein
MIRIKYNGRRFPRTISLRKHEKRVFLPGRREIDFDDYEAYALLKGNIRIAPRLWEFNIANMAPATPSIEEGTEIKKEKPKKHRSKKQEVEGGR